MQRSKQQAMFFLLGAMLVGGVVGASAARVMEKKPARVSARVQMYDDIGISAEKRVAMDSVLDDMNCKTSDIMASVRPSMDSVRAEGFRSLLGMMTPEQRDAYDARERRFKARMDSLEKTRDAQWAKDHPGAERHRCGGRSMAPGGTPAGGGRADRRGPGFM
jgi:hypothetical protein